MKKPVKHQRFVISCLCTLFLWPAWCLSTAHALYPRSKDDLELNTFVYLSWNRCLRKQGSYHKSKNWKIIYYTLRTSAWKGLDPFSEKQTTTCFTTRKKLIPIRNQRRLACPLHRDEGGKLSSSMNSTEVSRITFRYSRSTQRRR